MRDTPTTHCKRGHEFTPENTYIHATTGARQCKKCAAINVQLRYKANAEQIRERRRERYREQIEARVKTIVNEKPFYPSILIEWPLEITPELPTDWDVYGGEKFYVTSILNARNAAAYAKKQAEGD